MDDPQKVAALKASKAKSDGKVAKVLQKMPERKTEFVNISGIPVAQVYTPLDLQDFDYAYKNWAKDCPINIMVVNSPKTVCAWCRKIIREGNEPVSHGVCLECKDKF